MGADAGASRGGVLVTRPAGQGQALCEAIAEAGHPVHHQPLLELRELDVLPPEMRGHLLDLDQFQHVIFISGNAVRFGMERIEDYWPQLPVGIHWYAVGEQTAARLAEFGVSAQTPEEDMTSEGLLALPGLRSVEGTRVLIVKGEGGRSTLRDTLSRRGAQVEELACYRRCPPELAPGEMAAKLSCWGIELVLLSSGEGLANLRALLSPAETSKFTGISLIVPSPRVASMAREAGFEQVFTADNASDAAMLRALEVWDSRERDH